MNVAIRWFCSQPGVGRVVWRRAATLSCSAMPAVTDGVQAKGLRAGEIVIDQPYATPSLAGVRNGAVYLRGIWNQGEQNDRLTGASTPLARHVELQRSLLEAGVLRMREVDAIELPSRAVTSLRHGGEYLLMLVALRQPLREGDGFDLSLRFARGGSRMVSVRVQGSQPAGGEYP